MSRETSAHSKFGFGLKFLSLVFLIGAFLANTGLDWFVGNTAFFVRINNNKSGMSPEFCLFVIGGKEMLLYLIDHREQSQDLLLCLYG